MQLNTALKYNTPQKKYIFCANNLISTQTFTVILSTDFTKTFADHQVDIEMDGKMLNSHGIDFLDGPLGLELDEKDLDEEETRRDMARILKELKQKHPDREVCTRAVKT